ncbi:MAG: hydroxyacid dehydrogenase [Planctomycetes bacterium]|nr:hydroxyacid dehydrogenase [Planctomycetota bacterium]
MRALVADAFPETGLAGLQALGLDVVYTPKASPEEFASAAATAQIVIVRSRKVPRAVIEKAARLALIVRAGAGVNTIDVAAASERGVFVTNCPGKNAAAVAELAIGLLIALDRRIADATAELKAGAWNKSEYSKARGLKGRTLGVLGTGEIGRLVIARAQALEMRVLAWSRGLTDAAAKGLGVERRATPLEVAREADALTIHLALAPETRGLVGPELIAALPAGAIVINTARGEIVDEAALLAAAREKKLRLGLDVFAGEPAEGTANFVPAAAAAPVFAGTPHIGASTEEAQDAIAAEAVRIVRVFLQEGHAENCVNLARKTAARCQLVVRHFDKVGVLAGVLELLRSESINVQRVENIIFEGAVAACAKLELERRPSPAAVAELAARKESILGVELVDLA